MKYNKFCEVVRLLKECREVMDNTENIINPELFSSHSELITLLLKECYDFSALTMIMDKWLFGNKAPVVFIDNDGNEILIPINSTHDLWNAMEQYGRLR